MLTSTDTIRRAASTSLFMRYFHYIGSVLKNDTIFHELFISSEVDTIPDLLNPSVSSIIRFVQTIENSTDNVDLLMHLPVLYTHLNFFYPEKYTSWSLVPLSLLEKLFLEHNCIHLLGWLICSNRELSSTLATPCIPYTISEIDVLSRYQYFIGLEKRRHFLFSPLLSVSHAHIFHSLCSGWLAATSTTFKLSLFTIPQFSANSVHIRYLADLCSASCYDIDISSASINLPPTELLHEFSLYGDRISLLAASLVSNTYQSPSPQYLSMYRRCLPSVQITITHTRLPQLSKAPPASKPNRSQFQNFILLHNRDSAYKGQPHLSWRDSSIDALVDGCLSLFSSKRLLRIGASGYPVPASSGVIDLPNDESLIYNEQTLLHDALLLISTTSGPGHFAQELYGLRSLLLNATTLVTGDFIHVGKILSLKHIHVDSVYQKRLTAKSFIHALFRDWCIAPFSFRELTASEITQDILCLLSDSYSSFTFSDIHPYFITLMGDLSSQKVTLGTFNNLHECITATDTFC